MLQPQRGLYAEEGDTYIVEILSRLGSKVKIRRLTTAEGVLTDDFEPEEVSRSKIVSDRPLRVISPKVIFHFASPKINYEIKAASFVTHEKPLVSTCSHGLGSGIYGLHIKTQAQLTELKSTPDQPVYIIKCETPFFIQDSDHLNSLISASMATNRYIDNLINQLKNKFAGKTAFFNDFLGAVNNDNTDKLLILWSIVYSRSMLGNSLNTVLLNNLLANYLWEYFTDSSLRDSIKDDIIHELPINHIMRFLGYDSMIGDDRETNSWGRGCISFNYAQAQILEGYGSRQCIG